MIIIINLIYIIIIMDPKIKIYFLYFYSLEKDFYAFKPWQ